jgi:hypothetical protein
VSKAGQVWQRLPHHADSSDRLGGREHALAWKLRREPLCERLFIAPGNPGTADELTRSLRARSNAMP